MTDIGTDPTVDEILQDEAPALLSVPVRVEGVVRVQPLPAQGGAVKAVILAADALSIKVAKADPRRKAVRLIAVGQPVIFGYDQATADSSAGGVLPVGVVLSIDNRDAELWVRAGTPATASTLTIINDQWTQ